MNKIIFHNKIANIKSANCISETNSPNISLANKSSCTVLQTHGYETGSSPVLSVNIKSMGDVTSGVPMLLALLKAYSLSLLFSYF